MALYRQQSNTTANGGANSSSSAVSTTANAIDYDYVSVGVRGGSLYHQKRSHHHHHHRHRRFKNKRMSIGMIITFVCFVFSASGFAFVYLSGSHHSGNGSMNVEDEALRDDFLTNVTRFNTPEVMFGQGSTTHGRDSRYWDGDDRRRDEDYSEEEMNRTRKGQVPIDVESLPKKPINNVHVASDRHGLYNEAGRNELRIYEEQYEASLKNVGQVGVETEGQRDVENEAIDIDDEYDDGIDSHDVHIDDNDLMHESEIHSLLPKSHSVDHKVDIGVGRILADQSSLQDRSAKSHPHIITGKTREERTVTRSAKKPKNHRRHHSSLTCEMKLLSSTAQVVEPLESGKFARFTLSYTQTEQKPDGLDRWEPRFSGHQSLREREDSFIAHDQKINCGFVKGSKGYPGTGFDLSEDDYRYMSKCHIAVVSCIFGNSDRLRSPFSKAVSHLSRENVCFVMFMDERTLQTLSTEGRKPDETGYIGLWKVVVVKNLPFEDMRRVGKIPKLLSHRLFPSARYSIWLDSKLRLQRDPLLLLENFLWRKDYEYAISNHYDRHCVSEEVERNKKLNKFNHTLIDQQFQFYQADGLKRFNASDPNKLLPSNVPEGSLIIRAHTPMSNLFSCLWFNEVDRFTPRDQLSFAYTYQKLKMKNPNKPFYLNMFKDCERRQIAKLFRHRTDEQRNIAQAASE